MSGRLVGRCLRESRTTQPTALLVLVTIAEHSRDEGFGAALNIETIARESRLSPRHIKRLVRHLADLGDLSVISHRGRTNIYMVHPGVGTPVSPPTGDTHVPTRTGEPGTSATESGDIRDPKVGTSATESGDIREHASRTVEPYEPYEPAPPRRELGAAPGGAFPKGRRIQHIDGEYRVTADPPLGEDGVSRTTWCQDYRGHQRHHRQLPDGTWTCETCRIEVSP